MKRSHTYIAAHFLGIIVGAIMFAGPGAPPNDQRMSEIGNQLAAYASVHTGGNPTTDSDMVQLIAPDHVLPGDKFACRTLITNLTTERLYFTAFLHNGNDMVQLVQNLSPALTNATTHVEWSDWDPSNFGENIEWQGYIPPGGHVFFKRWLQAENQNSQTQVCSSEVHLLSIHRTISPPGKIVLVHP